MKKNILMLLAAVMLLGMSACSQSGSLSVVDVWARPGLAGGNGAVFFQIDNGADEDDQLISAASDAAEAVEIHKTTMVDGVMKMNRQKFVNVPASDQIKFEPGGLHVMLIGLKEDLEAGESFEIVLTFEKAGDILLEVPVQEP